MGAFIIFMLLLTGFALGFTVRDNLEPRTTKKGTK